MSILFADGRSIEEALGHEIYDEARHPRGRGGKWVAVLGRIASLHKDLGGHPGVQNRLDRGHMTAGDMTRVRSFAGKQDGEAASELRRLATEVQAHMRENNLTSMRPTAGAARSTAGVPEGVRAEGKRLGMTDSQIAQDHERYGKIAGWRGGRAAPGGERHASVLFAEHRGGGSGLVPGRGVTRMQPDEQRAATRMSPGGERRNPHGPLGANARGTHFRFPAHADNPDMYRVEGRDEKGRVIATKVVAGTKHKFNPTEENYRRDERGAQAFLRTPGGERGKTFSPGDRVQHRDGGQGKVTGETTNGRVPVKFDDGSRDPNHVFSVKPEELESLERPKAKGSKMSRRRGYGLLTEAVVEAVRREFGK